MRIKIRKGLDIPIQGRPDQIIEDGNPVTSVALLGSDVHGLKPRMAVSVGDRVRLGQALYTDKRNADVSFTAPGAGEVVAIHRGARRTLQSVVIRLEGDDAERFDTVAAADIAGVDAGTVRRNLARSGLWTAFRTRPYSHIPATDDTPAAIFVTAIDTNPLAADPAVVLAASHERFLEGLRLIAKLTDGHVYVCTAPDSGIPCPGDEQFRHAEFEGPHPAGLPGTHIHFLEPVGGKRTVWHIGYQDVVAIAELFAGGRLPVERVISLGGPKASRPRLLRTRAGANVGELIKGETEPGRLRVISGSVLNGHSASGPFGWLGRYHTQVCLLAEGREREFLSWMRPGIGKFSVERAYAGRLGRGGGFAMTTSQNGSPRAMVSIGSFEKLVPIDILPTPLLKALIVMDTDKARALGCLELDEEDLALCSFACNGKYEYGRFLRMNLDEIEVNG